MTTTTEEEETTVASKNSTHSHLWWSCTIDAQRTIPDQWDQKFYPDRASADWWLNDGPNVIKVEGLKAKKDGSRGKLRTQVWFYLKPKKKSEHKQTPAPQWVRDLFEAAKQDPTDEPHDPERKYWGN